MQEAVHRPRQHLCRRSRRGAGGCGAGAGPQPARRGGDAGHGDAVRDRVDDRPDGGDRQDHSVCGTPHRRRRGLCAGGSGPPGVGDAVHAAPGRPCAHPHRGHEGIACWTSRPGPSATGWNASAARWARSSRWPHTIEAVAEGIARLKATGHDPVLVFGASAIVDRGDVVPAGLVAAGGQVIHLGMPVDPGNLLMLGSLGGQAGHRRAVVRALAQAQRLRLGAGAGAGRYRRAPAGHHGHGGRRAADGNRDAALSA